MNEQTLRNSLKTPALKERRAELEGKLRSLAPHSLARRDAVNELRDLNQDITKAEAHDDLLTWQAWANLGFPVC